MAHDDGHAHPILGEALVYVDHLLGLGDGLLAGGVGRVALLPEELGGAEEQTRAHLPAHDVGPLVAEDGQVAVGGDPVLVGVPDYGLRGGAHDKLLLQFGGGVDHDALAVGVVLQTVVGHHGALLGEALHMVRLAREERFGDEEREIGVLVSRLFEHVVQHALHLLPDGVTVGFDYHTSSDGRIFGQTGLHNEVVVPFRVVVLDFGQIFKLYCHIAFLFRNFRGEAISEHCLRRAAPHTKKKGRLRPNDKSNLFLFNARYFTRFFAMRRRAVRTCSRPRG